MTFLLLLLLLQSRADAEEAKPVTPPVPATAGAVTGPVTYELRGLKPAGFTQYVGAGDAIRLYFDFQNEQGVHHIIYEEVGGSPPARTVQSLREAASAYATALEAS